MAERDKSKKGGLPMVNPDAAGIDIGAREIFAAVPEDRDARAVRRFPTFTEDLHALADWLIQCRIQTVAMEATGVYWIPLFQILEDRGLEVCLVNARYFQNVPGRRTDVGDCQWLQHLHAVGLLRGSFRPPQQICALRSLWRHRESLVEIAAVHVQHLQKALDQMNLQIHHVLSDITGVTGLAMMDAILSGQRDPAVLSKLRQPSVKADEETVRKSLIGDYRQEHLFTLRQSLAAYRHYQTMIAEVDEEVQQLMRTLQDQCDSNASPPAGKKKRRNRPQHNEPRFDLRSHLYRICGVDLTEIPGIHVMTAQTILTEIGPDLSRFPTEAAFTSWLGLCPQREVSGGKLLSSHTRRVKNRAAHALRLGVYTLHHGTSHIAHYYRKMRARLGAPKAITATAHKLARILYKMLTTRIPYDETILAAYDQAQSARQQANLALTARRLGFQLIPLPSTPAEVH